MHVAVLMPTAHGSVPPSMAATMLPRLKRDGGGGVCEGNGGRSFLSGCCSHPRAGCVDGPFERRENGAPFEFTERTTEELIGELRELGYDVRDLGVPVEGDVPPSQAVN